MPSQTNPSAEQAGHEAWLKAAARSLKGADLESLVLRTVEGVEIRPLYDDSGAPERLRSSVGWDIRAQVSAADPAGANALAHEALGGGCNSLLLDTRCFTSAEDMARALEGVVLEAAPVAVKAGFAGPLAAQWLAEATRGSPSARLEFHLDPLSAFAEAGVSPGPIEGHIVRAAETAASLAPTYPEATLFLACGRTVHEAAATSGRSEPRACLRITPWRASLSGSRWTNSSSSPSPSFARRGGSGRGSPAPAELPCRRGSRRAPRSGC